MFQETHCCCPNPKRVIKFSKRQLALPNTNPESPHFFLLISNLKIRPCCRMAPGLKGKMTHLDEAQSSVTRPFRLLDLPLELRNNVYFHMVGPKFPTERFTRKGEINCISSWFNANILLTSHQIYYEAKAVIYNQRVSVLVLPLAKTWEYHYTSFS